MKKTVIQYYRRSVYGNTLEYIKDPGQARIVRQLTGKRTIDSVIRELLRDLTGSHIEWQEVVAP